jgi:hypothetical protein
VQTRKTVEIRDQLTFELLTLLQFHENTPYLFSTGPLVYSPDGRSIALGFPDAVAIWDIQTGGVAKVIKCSRDRGQLVWSLDGRSIAIIAVTTRGLGGDTVAPGPKYVEMYDVASGVCELTVHSGVNYLWACKNSFRSLYLDHNTLSISTSMIGGPTPTEPESFSNAKSWKDSLFSYSPSPSAFSPSTYRICILGSDMVQIFDIRNKRCLLKKIGPLPFPSFFTGWKSLWGLWPSGFWPPQYPHLEVYFWQVHPV